MTRLTESYLDFFVVNDNAYQHTIDLSDDATYIRRGDAADDEWTFKVDSSAYVYNEHGALIGFFHLNARGWAYLPNKRLVGAEGIETDTQDLLKAERQVFKLLLEKA